MAPYFFLLFSSFEIASSSSSISPIEHNPGAFE
jgi:hypothetical protein